MKDVSSCPICSSSEFVTYPAMVSGFLAERIWGKEPWKVELRLCRGCHFAFFNPRLEPQELARLYQGYRDEEYQRMRERHEPNYTKEFNASLGSVEEQTVRKGLLKNYLGSERELDEIRSVLDFGGDRGQFIIDELRAADRYVYEVSGTTPEPGIISLKSLDECGKRRYDLIMCCHVLEHVPDPLVEMGQITELADESTLIYVELPYGSPFDLEPTTFKKRIFRLISSNHALTVLLLKMMKSQFLMHEHINYFDESSLNKLMERCGLKVIKMDIPEFDIGPMKVRIIRCLAQKRGAHDQPGHDR